jgi:DNA topoisomerase-1
MSKQFCYDILNGRVKDPDSVKKFIVNLYKSEFPDISYPDDLPFIVAYDSIHNKICVTVKTKKRLESVDKIHQKLNSSKLKHKDVEFGLPYLFEVKQTDWIKKYESDKTIQKTDDKWTTLTHNGPYFPHISEEQIVLGVYLIYNGIKYELNPREEKVALFYAKRIISENKGGVVVEFTKDNTFNQNFWTDFKNYLRPEYRKLFKDFKLVDWSDVVQKVLDFEEDKKSKAKQFKSKRQTELEERKLQYSHAYIDGNMEKLGNFVVEPAGLFLGRGLNPNRGKIKPDIFPEDVTINMSLNSEPPKPPGNHRWGSIVQDKTGTWVAKWKDPIINEMKYVRFSQEGKFKGESDLLKYEKARKLNLHIKQVRREYMSDADSSDLKMRQMGTVLYLIDHYGVRVGNEKSEDEADTVGASTLKVNHLKFREEDRVVIFDFLGKDSIRFYKELELPGVIYNNFKKFTRGKSDSDQVFDLLSSSDINEYLKKFDSCFSAKVFRTRLASTIMSENLKTLKIPRNTPAQEIKLRFNERNAKVAEVLNHTRNISKKSKEAVDKCKSKLKELVEERKKLKGKSLDAINKKIQTVQTQIESKTNVLGIAITTSLTNYIDPRIVVSWAKAQNVNIPTIYTTTMQKKFKWAIESTESDWDYDTSDIVGGTRLEPKIDMGTSNTYASFKKPVKKPVKTFMDDTRETSSSVRKPVKTFMDDTREASSSVKKPVKTFMDDTREASSSVRKPVKTPVKTFFMDDTREASSSVRKPEPKTTKQYHKIPDLALSQLDNNKKNIDGLKILCEICNKDDISKKDYLKLLDVDAKVLLWVYPFSKSLVESYENIHNLNKVICGYVEDSLL